MIISLSGENSFALHAELEKLVQQFITEQGDIALERLDGEEASFEQLQEGLQSLPFLSNKKMVILRSPSANKHFVATAETLLKGLPETTELILVEPKLDKRSSYYKLLKKTTDFRDYPHMDAAQLVKWLVASAKERGGRLSAADAVYLVDRVGANHQLAATELDKLLLYEPNITRQTIDLLTEPTPQSSVFELLEAAFGGNAKLTLTLYAEQRSMKVEPQQIIAMLAWQLHVLALVKTAGERPPQAIAAESKINPFVVRKSSGIARRLSLAQLKKLVVDLAVLDIRLKRASIDADDALQNYLLAIAMHS